MRYMDRSRFWACDFWAIFVILTCSCLLRTASGDPRTAVAGQFYDNNANHEKNLAREQRIDIVQGVAEELSYLHKESKTRIIHRDIKATNIPLDDKFKPKITDFDLTRALFKEKTNVSIKAAIRGTLLRPRLAGCTIYPWYAHFLHEYLKDMAITLATGDVLSIGVQVFEIMTGERCKGWKQLRLVVGRHYNNDRLEEIVHERIYQVNTVGYIRRVIHIGLICTDPDQRNRPRMAEVVQKLSARPY